MQRLDRPRDSRSVTTPWGEVQVKIAGGPYGPEQVKPEYEDCRAIARAHNIPFREVVRVVLERAFTRMPTR
jgi:pyridinium-3,5-bisthiocarboxylic acid mononucleotide nickel chelatase